MRLFLDASDFMGTVSERSNLPRLHHLLIENNLSISLGYSLIPQKDLKREKGLEKIEIYPLSITARTPCGVQSQNHLTLSVAHPCR